VFFLSPEQKRYELQLKMVEEEGEEEEMKDLGEEVIFFVDHIFRPA